MIMLLRHAHCVVRLQVLLMDVHTSMPLRCNSSTAPRAVQATKRAARPRCMSRLSWHTVGFLTSGEYPQGTLVKNPEDMWLNILRALYNNMHPSIPIM